MDYREKYEKWLADPYFDEDTKAELIAIKDNDKEIKERFYKDMEFGTAGLRGVMGAGTSRMNIYTVRKATQGLAQYILKSGKQAKGVAIAYDSRHMSPQFADEAALCLCANGIKAYVFESLRPTPELSYAIRKLKCVSGINVTASHNPREYNGYKVYWEDGAQVTSPHDEGIMNEARLLTDYSMVKTMSREKAIEQGLYEIIGKEIDEDYIAEVESRVLRPDAIRKVGDDFRIVYTPLYGTGNLFVRRVLKDLGFKNVYVVKEQELPDGDFPTAPYPNPEADDAFSLALKLAKEKNADMAIATDPDGDRLGVYVRDGEGEYQRLTGNVVGCLLADYELGQRKAIKGLPEDGYIIKTVVSTNMAEAIARHYGVGIKVVLTGFKNICREILESEKRGKGEYLFGFEESYGYLIGDYARDKDGVSAAMAICEAGAYYKTKGMTLADAAAQMYGRYGYYKDGIRTASFKGLEGAEKMKKILSDFRQDPPEEIAGHRTLKVRDYLLDTVKDLTTGETEKAGLPKSNVLYYETGSDAWLCVRPSGTEPKVKFYYGVRGGSEKEAEENLQKAAKQVEEMVGEML